MNILVARFENYRPIIPDMTLRRLQTREDEVNTILGRLKHC
jgi:hypothetical protein